MTSQRQEFANLLLATLHEMDDTVDASVIIEETGIAEDTAQEVLTDLVEADWVTVSSDWDVGLTEHAAAELDDPGQGSPLTTIDYLDSGAWVGSRCFECGAFSFIDAQYSAAGGVHFCSACGAQLVSDEALQARDRTAANLQRNTDEQDAA